MVFPASKHLSWIVFSFAILNYKTRNVETFAPSRCFIKPCHRRSKSTNKNRLFAEGDRQPLVTTISKNEDVSLSPTRTNVTLSFPPFYNLVDVRPGEFIASEAFSCCAPGDNIESCEEGRDDMVSGLARHQFRVKFFPRGRDGEKKIPSILQSSPQEVVGLYLQYLGLEGSNNGNDAVNATFALRLKGQQRQQRFDIEWRAGMRFVSDLKDSNLNQGDANEFGFPLMQTLLLSEFVGIDSNQMLEPKPILVEVEVLIHNTAIEETIPQSSPQSTNSKIDVMALPDTPFSEDIRRRKDGQTYSHDTERVRVGKIVVPVLSRLSQRPQMFERGTYPGVEYRILRILKNDQERFTSCPEAIYELKPVYPLVGQLERQWPIAVNEKDIPRLYSPSMYNILSVVGSLLTASAALFTAFLLSQAISFFYIPSKSMDPTLRVGDVLLVDKFSSKSSLRQSSQNKVGDIVLFSPPSELRQIVARNGGNLNSRDLFVKRIAASTGDKVTVFKDGKVEVNNENIVDGQRDLCEAEPLRLIEKYIQPIEDKLVDSEEVFVMGDCSSVSVDSRVWGPLETKNIVGRPILRLWPLDRFGKVE